MIFVTVGTHEQAFNRVIEEIDKLKKEGIIKEEVIIQLGYSTYEPSYCKWEKIISYDEMMDNMKKARIIITHGGPATFMMALQLGKIPVVVPRQYEFNEHVNNHQVDFTKIVADRYKNIIPVYNMSELKDVIENYDSEISQIPQSAMSNNREFNNKFEEVVENLF